MGRNPTRYSQEALVYQVRDNEIRLPLYTESLSHTQIPKIALPGFQDPGKSTGGCAGKMFPDNSPIPAGVFPLKRTDEDPTRMFAGEGDPARTNRRFHFLSGNYEANRLSTAFDSVTLYGFDPDIQPGYLRQSRHLRGSLCSIEDVKVSTADLILRLPTPPFP